jgi:ribonuclease D
MHHDAILIDTEAAWHPVGERLRRTSILGLDLEADGFHRYPERVALIQLSLPDHAIWLIDPLALAGVPGLGDVLGDPTVRTVVHSAAFDVRSLDRDFGFRIRGLSDTAIAAQFCGLERTGLANVLAELLGVEVAKSRRLQRMDWSRRPLSDEALRYAAGDVEHLLALDELLAERLAELGRTAWVAEECRRMEGVRYAPPDPPERAFWTVRGARKLSPRERAVLRELYVLREREARRTGRPPYRVMSNEALLTLARQPDLELETVSGIPRRTLAQARRRLEDALDRGRRAPGVKAPRPAARNPWTDRAKRRLRRLKHWRQGEAERLALDPGIVWPLDHLKRIALNPTEGSANLDTGEPGWVRRWQWAEMGRSLARFRRDTLRDTGG